MGRFVDEIVASTSGLIQLFLVSKLYKLIVVHKQKYHNRIYNLTGSIRIIDRSISTNVAIVQTTRTYTGGLKVIQY